MMMMMMMMIDQATLSLWANYSGVIITRNAYKTVKTINHLKTHRNLKIYQENLKKQKKPETH